MSRLLACFVVDDLPGAQTCSRLLFYTTNLKKHFLPECLFCALCLIHNMLHIKYTNTVLPKSCLVLDLGSVEKLSRDLNLRYQTQIIIKFLFKYITYSQERKAIIIKVINANLYYTMILLQFYS